ncbi:porin family protein [Acidihalobacter prosperus]|uniref:Porin domain-containing protein n=1 Tax=Acidihalobacter prosperus TaxID=160660 RepID=A0A1A6C570_9GAMM|nr:hypothetical protein [Acidihalobacter prosperus]OBS09707.1 hypothetical protein Thpro_022035 [Acidihalobacter prosperus]
MLIIEYLSNGIRRSSIAVAAFLMVHAPTAFGDTSFMRSVGTSSVAPRVSIMGRGIATADGSTSDLTVGGSQPGSMINYSDSFLDAQFDSRLYSGIHGGMLLGLRFPDAGSGIGPVFYHQVNVFLESQHWGMRIGRTSLPNYLIAFPTLRDSDLIEYTQVPNAMINTAVSEYSQYGDVLKGSYYWLHSRLRLTGFASHQFETSSTGQLLDRYSFNSGGIQVNYELSPGNRYASWLRQLGAEVYYQDVRNLPNRQHVYSYVFGGVINLNRDPIDHWDLRFQAISNQGAGVHSVSTVQSQAQARSQAYVVSLRRVRSPYLVPRLQLALTIAYQRFDGVSASRYSIVPNITYRLGANTSLIAQYAYLRNHGGLQYSINGQGADLKSNSTVTVGLAYDFGTTSNDYFGNRTSLLNTEHGYLP